MPFDPLAVANELADAPAYERAVLEHLDRSIGFDAAFFVTLGETPTTVALDPTTLERGFAHHTYDHELWPLKTAALQARGVAVDTHVLGEPEVRRRAYYREMVAPMRGRHSLMAFMFLRGRPLGSFMLGRTGSTFTPAEIEAIESLLPRITFGRASFHVPFAGEPLREAPRGSLVTRAYAWARGERTLAEAPGISGSVRIRDRDGYREMVAVRPDAELVWSRAELGDPRRSGWFYVDLFHLAAARARRRTRALFIGCGGAVGVRQFAEVYPGIAIDLVDVDSAVVGLARDWYGLASIPQLVVHVADGFDFVERAAPEQWDVVVVDAYDASDVPTRMETRRFFRQLRRVLRRGGCMAMNTIGTLGGASPVHRVERASRAELEDVRLVPVLDPDEMFSAAATRNVIVLGGA